MHLSTSFKYICSAMALLASPSAAQSSSIVFVTSTKHNGNLGGLSGADAICQGLADSALIGGTYMAWISDSTGASPSTRFFQSQGIYRNVASFTIADDWNDLIDGTNSNLNMDEYGNTYTGTVWTNTNIDGTRSDSLDCNGWTASDNTISGKEGYINRVDASWTVSSGGVRGCGYADARLYCFQQLGVPPTPPASQLTANTWAVTYQSDAAVDFKSTSTSEVVLSYQIGTGKVPTVSLYASSDCSATTAITADVATATESVVTGSTLDTLTVSIDIDKTKILASNIWNSGDSSLEFCIAVKLESSGEVIIEDLQSFDIAFNFDVAFSADTFDATEDSAGTVTTVAANLNDSISACKCDGATCNTSALGPDDLLQVCIMSSSSEVVVSQVKDLDLAQNSNSMAVVDGGSIVNPALSETTDYGVQTVVPSKFFTSTAPISVSGNVLVEFASGRRQLVAFGDNDAKSIDGRMMLDSPFDSNNPEGLVKESAHHIHLTVDPSQEVEGNFDFEVGVKMASDESKFNAASTLGITKVLVGAVVLSFAYLW